MDVKPENDGHIKGKNYHKMQTLTKKSTEQLAYTCFKSSMLINSLINLLYSMNNKT